MSSDVAIIGVGQTPYRRVWSAATPDLVFDTVTVALADAGITMADVDLVVGGFAPDGLAGERSPDKSFLPAAGSVGRASFRVNTGGATGIGAAYSAIEMLEGGLADVAVVVAVERMAQAATVPAIFNSIFDPIYERDTGLSTLSMCAMRATRMMKLWGYTPEIWADISVRNFAHAMRNPHAQLRRAITRDDVLSSPMLTWPIRKYDACPISEGVCVVVVARGEVIGRTGRPVAWVRGRGSVSDTYEMGDRIGRAEGDLVELLSLQKAAARAYAQAGISSGHDAQVIEIHAPFNSAETMAYMPLGLCKAPEGPDLAASGFGAWGSPTVLQPSGGPQTANPVGATALVRLAEAAEQVRGTAGERQVDGARIAIATGQGGASQFSTCTVVSA
ncbi:thiolase family protein [Sporichthya polymorpha]|uniref:thiolase family protein n=1 Tax=Sporichthya polymorpha TaxID=35751 RepID=UPI000376B3C3|nr:thiolase family protein [Sporichthya polymorpha]